MIWGILAVEILALIGMAFLERAEKAFNVAEDEEIFDFANMLGAWGCYLLSGGFFLGMALLLALYLLVHA